MENEISGFDRTTAAAGNASNSALADKGVEKRQLFRDVMGNHAFKEAKMSLIKGYRRRLDAQTTLGADKPSRPIGADSLDAARAKQPIPFLRRTPDASILIDAEALFESINFSKGSIEELVSKGLAGSMSKAECNLVAIELGKLVNCAAYYYDLTTEKKAANREIGLRLARFFAQSYFDDPTDEKACLERIESFIERNEMLDKGYYFWAGQAYESYKPVPISIIYKLGEVHWSKETADEFRNNEKKVAEIIRKAKLKVGDNEVSEKLGKIFRKFGLLGGVAAEGGDLGAPQRVLAILSA